MEPLGGPVDDVKSRKPCQTDQPINDDELAWVQDWVQEDIDAEEVAELFGPHKDDDDDMDINGDVRAMVSTLQTLGVEVKTGM